MATITFSTIPIQSLLVPTVAAEIDPSGANTTGQVYRTLLIGTMLATGTATPNVPVLTSGGSDAQTMFGIGSMAAMMVADYRQQDPFGELWVLPIAIPTAGSATTATMTLTGPATGSGNLYFYLGGQLIQSAVSAGDTATAMAANLAAAAALVSGLPATLTAAAGVITITPIDKTIAGSDIDLQMNYLGTAGGQALPAGVTVAFSAPNVGGGIAGGGGVANPSIAAGLANLGSQPYDFIITGLNDPTNLALIASLLNDQSGRWSWIQELFGHGVAFHNGSLSQQAAFVAALNNQHLSVFGGYKSPWPMYRCAADAGGAWAVSARANPVLPVQNIDLNMPAPPLQYRFDISDRNVALTDGVSTIKVNDAGGSVLERMVTTYTLNPAGAPDSSYRDVETMDTLTYLIRDIRSWAATTYARKILVADGTPISGGSAMTTAQVILADFISRYKTYCDAGYCQNYDTFKAAASAVNMGNGIVALQLPLDLGNQLRVLAMKIDFKKS